LPIKRLFRVLQATDSQTAKMDITAIQLAIIAQQIEVSLVILRAFRDLLATNSQTAKMDITAIQLAIIAQQIEVSFAN
jgi:hypothetical protein